MTDPVVSHWGRVPPNPIDKNANSAPDSFAIGERVQVTRLKKADTKYNEGFWKVKKYKEDKKLWTVVMELDGAKKAVRGWNLVRQSDHYSVLKPKILT